VCAAPKSEYSSISNFCTFFSRNKKAEKTILPLSIVVVGAFGNFFLSVGSELGRTKQRTSSAIDRMGPLVEGQFGLVQ